MAEAIEKNRILVCDDEEFNRMLLKNFFDEEYEVDVAENGNEALALVEKRGAEYSAILSDLQMPVMSGVELLGKLAERGVIEKVPVIVITGEVESGIETLCLRLGATDFIRKPFNFPVIARRLRNAVDLFRYQHLLEERVVQQMRALRAQNNMLARQASLLRMQTARLLAGNKPIVNLLSDVVESRDSDSGKHINRLKMFIHALGEQYMADHPESGLTEDAIDVIANASPLHDIGKIAVSDSVLLKPEGLTPEEFEVVKAHTAYGYELLEGLQGLWEPDYYRACREICRWHHEKYDGSGYPDGLKGDEIPLSAQLVSLADAYDALVTERVYQKAFSAEEAFTMIIEGECGTFSPMMLESFKRAFNEFDRITSLQYEEESPDLHKPVSFESIDYREEIAAAVDSDVAAKLLIGL